MKTFINAIILIITFTLVLCDLDGEAFEWQMYATNAPAEIYVLALILPGGNNSPTIHGLWPQYQRTKTNFRILDDYGPLDCKFYGTYQVMTQMKEAQGMKNDLETKWKSYTGPNEKFWEHEWVKHGNCAPNLGPKGNKPQAQLEYFNLALKLYDKYIGQVNNGLNIVKNDLSKGLKLSTVLNTFVKTVGRTIELTCERKNVNGSPRLVVTQAYLCIDLAANKNKLNENLLLNCNRNLGDQYQGYCGGLNTTVYYV